jgi:ribosomal protein L24
MSRRKAVKDLKKLVNTYDKLYLAKQNMNKKNKNSSDNKPYEPLFDSEEEIKIAKVKLILLGVEV